MALLLLLQALPALATPMVLGYRGAMSGVEIEYGNAVAIDGSGNFYITGEFRGTVDFDPGPGVFEMTSTPGPGSRRYFDAYVCKLDSSGQFLWVKNFDGGDQNGLDLVVDAAGNVYTTGIFEGTVDFDPGPGVYEIDAGRSNAIYVCKLDSAGDFLWAISASTGYRDTDGWPTGIALDEVNGGVYYTGRFVGNSDFDPGPGTQILRGQGETDAFICKLDEFGNFQWAAAIGGAESDVGTKLATDSSGSVYATGYFEDTVDFDPGPGTFNLTSAALQDAFVLKLGPDGAFQWAGAISGSGYAQGLDIAVDAADGVHFTGLLSGDADFDPGSGIQILTSSGYEDAFVCKLDQSGSFQWVSALGGDRGTRGYGVVTGDSGHVYCIGIFSGTSDFDPGPGEWNITSYQNVTRPDAFVAKLDSFGALEWAGSMGGSADDVGSGIDVDNEGTVYCVGSFSETIHFDWNTNAHNIPGQGLRDVFVMKLEPQSLPVATRDVGHTNADEILTSVEGLRGTSLLNNDVDVNTLAVLTVTAHDATSNLGATVLVNPDGTFVYDPTVVPAFQALAPGESLVDTFTYTLSDGTDTDVGTVTITVFGAGTTMPTVGMWSVALLGFGLVGAGVWAARTRQ